MKVYIGNYTNWIGPYQIAEKILFWKNKYEDRSVHKFGRWLATNKHGDDSWLMKTCQWVNDKKKRRIYIKVDRWDSWNASDTISMLALPILKQLKTNQHGAPCVDDEDVPAELRRCNAPATEEYETDDNHFKRWNWVLDEIIWTHEQLAYGDESQFFHDIPRDAKVPDGWKWVGGIGKANSPGFWVDRASETAWNERIDNGIRLFGKYYRGLWD